MNVKSPQCKKKINMKELDNFYDKFVTAAMRYHSRRHEFGETRPLFTEENRYKDLERLLIKISRDQEKKKR